MPGSTIATGRTAENGINAPPADSTDELGMAHILYQLFGPGHAEPLSKGMVPAASSGLRIEGSFQAVVDQAVRVIQGPNLP